MSELTYGLFVRGQYPAGDDMVARFEEVKAQVRLADRLRLPLGSLRSLLTRLQKQKLVQRKAGRGKTPDQVTLSAKGKKLAAEVVGRHHRDLAEILRAAPDANLENLRAELAQTGEGLEARFARQSRGERS